MEVVLQLRGGNSATVKDVVDLRKSLMQHNERLVDSLYMQITDRSGSNTASVAIEDGGMPVSSESSMQLGGMRRESKPSDMVTGISKLHIRSGSTAKIKRNNSMSEEA